MSVRFKGPCLRMAGERLGGDPSSGGNTKLPPFFSPDLLPLSECFKSCNLSIVIPPFGSAINLELFCIRCQVLLVFSTSVRVT